MLAGAEGGARFQDRGSEKPRLIDGFVGWATRTPETLAAVRKSFSVLSSCLGRVSRIGFLRPRLILVVREAQC